LSATRPRSSYEIIRVRARRRGSIVCGCSDNDSDRLSRLSVDVDLDHVAYPGRQRILAVQRLRRGVERLPTALPQEPPVSAGALAMETPQVRMRMTPFPSRASEVVALTVPEFTSELDLSAAGSFESVCGRFVEDANRALVWFIRYRALTAWCEQADMAAWLHVHPSYPRHACEVAASFSLNDDWQFDPETFRSAVESVAR
jgi:hypothetical protein